MHCFEHIALEDEVFTREQVLSSTQLSRFQKVLLLSDGSVTELLCIYSGQDVRAVKIDQSIRTGGAPSILGVSTDTRVLWRQIMLTDPDGPQVYAESFFVHNRLSPSTERLLHESDSPIGKLWKQEKAEMYREIVDIRLTSDSIVASRFGLPPITRLLSRTYLLWHNGTRMGAITEKFPLVSFG